MNKTIREASTYLAGLLPPDPNFFSTDDLLRLGMPDFIVRRINLEVADRLEKSLTLPTSDWLDTERSNIKSAWVQFIEGVKGDAHLPRRQAADIIDNAVIETVELIISPRRRVIEWLFGPSQELVIGQVRQRAQYITINRYLTDALIRYMDRKDLPVITRSAAVDVVRTVDERYVSGFTPMNWAQLIDPLFQIARNRVDSELVHDFFVDKDREDLADLFPETSSRIDRAQLIERLTVGSVSRGEDHPISSIVPIWQQYLSEIPEEVDADIEDEESSPLVESLPDFEPQPAPIISSLKSVGLQKAALVDWLKTDEITYIEGLFDGNEMAYYRTISQLETCTDWDEVQLILKEWVRSADIDLHNADLALLVDQLQLYFSTNDS